MTIIQPSAWMCEECDAPNEYTSNLQPCWRCGEKHGSDPHRKLYTLEQIADVLESWGYFTAARWIRTL